MAWLILKPALLLLHRLCTNLGPSVNNLLQQQLCCLSRAESYTLIHRSAPTWTVCLRPGKASLCATCLATRRDWLEMPLILIPSKYDPLAKRYKLSIIYRLIFLRVHNGTIAI